MIVGIIPEAPDGRILMCRRGISPRRGFWTFPAGYLENDETCCEGAAREAREEAEALVEPLGLYMVINVLEVQQVHLIYRGRLRASAFGPGPESAEVKLVPEDCIPWGELAFPAIETCLRQYFADRIRGRFPVHTMDVIEPRGASALGAAAAWTQMISPPGIAQA